VWSQQEPVVMGTQTQVVTVASPALLPLRYPTIPRHLPEYLWGTCIPLTLRYSTIPRHLPEYLRGTCIPLTLSYPTIPRHLPKYLRGTCIPPTLRYPTIPLSPSAHRLEITQSGNEKRQQTCFRHKSLYALAEAE